MTNLELIKKYASAIARIGINVQEDDNVQINTDIDSLPVAREIAKICWQAKANDVLVKINDKELSLIAYENAKIEALEKVQQFKVDYNVAQMKNIYHRISLTTANPDFFKEVTQDRLQAVQKANSVAFKPVRSYIDSGEIKWVVANTASPYWANQLFPELETEEAVDKLWQLIFAACRIDADDPVAAWKEHNQALKAHESWLDEQQFDYLVYEAPGTNLKVHLAENHKWIGGDSLTKDGIAYMANMPTEEIFTTPHRDKVEGHIRSTKPLSLMGKIIDEFTLYFENGKVVKWEAEQNQEILDILLHTDEGAKHFGEIALVPHSSPISKTNVLFKSTLFDENASCHFALGQSYAETIIDGENLSVEERESFGANQSTVHTDFMVGSEHLNVTGFKKDGSAVPVLVNGEWAINV